MRERERENSAIFFCFFFFFFFYKSYLLPSLLPVPGLRQVIEELRPGRESVPALAASASLTPLLLRRGGRGGRLRLFRLFQLCPPDLGRRCGLGRSSLLLLGLVERRLFFQGLRDAVDRSSDCFRRSCRCCFCFFLDLDCLIVVDVVVVVVALGRRRRLLPAASSSSSSSSSSIAREARGKLREVDRGVVVVTVLLG